MRQATVLALLLVACDRKPATPTGGAVPSGPVAVPPVSALPALGPTPKLERTEDGIAILSVRAPDTERSGSVRFVRPMAKTLQWTSSEASDGARIYVAISKDAPDIVIRGGELHEGLLRSLGVQSAGCAAARDGELLLSGIVESDRQQRVETLDGRSGRRGVHFEPAKEQAVFRIDAAGRIEKRVLPNTVATNGECRIWPADGGKYTLATFGLVSWDGTEFKEDRSWFAGRLTMGRVNGPKFCFRYCNEAEKRETHPDTEKLLSAVGNGNAEFVAHGPWVAGTGKGRAIRWKEDGSIETLNGLPESKMLNGHYLAVFTERGDLVIGIDYRFARYVVWPLGAQTHSGVRTLPPGDVLAKASPTLIVRGLGGSVPESNTYAVVVGKDIGYGTGGSTYGYSELRRSAEAHKAQVDRARAVLGKDSLWVAHEAVMDPECGAHVRSPLGWEAMKISDFSPPTLPKLSPRAVTKKPACLPLSSAAVLPGAPDLLLAISGGALWGAWLPPPLPLPQGSHFGRRTDDKPVVQHPKPGAGWTKVGAATAISGEPALPGPGSGNRFDNGTWQAGGGAIIQVDRQEILFTPLGAVTLPPGTRPMAVGTAQHFRAWGAIGDKVVDCAERCRVLDPGTKQEIVGLVPRTETTLMLGFADGRVGVYEVPPSGGEWVETSPLVAELTKLLASRPQDGP